MPASSDYLEKENKKPPFSAVFLCQKHKLLIIFSTPSRSRALSMQLSGELAKKIGINAPSMLLPGYLHAQADRGIDVASAVPILHNSRGLSIGKLVRMTNKSRNYAGACST